MLRSLINRAPRYDVVVIGGGVVGTSVLHHLMKLGCKRAALLEREVLTAGSTWHAAGGFHALSSDSNVTKLQSYTIGLYKDLEKESGLDCGLHFTGGVNVASTPERWDYLQNEHAKHKVMGLQTKLLSPEEVKAWNPLIDIEGLYGGLFDRNEGHLDCNAVTQAFAKVAKMNGAVVQEHCKVEGMERREGVWQLDTSKGPIEAVHVINCGGLWAREVGQMVGVHVPILPMQHHYIITEPIEELATLSHEIPMTIDLDGNTYLRQERGGVLIGFYEEDCAHWSAESTPWNFGAELLEPDFDRLGPTLEMAFARYPVLGETGIARTVNGPFTFAPDGNPVVGPVREVDNYWLACGIMAGFAQGGGVGRSLAEWILHGEPSIDIMAMDCARFGDYADKNYTFLKSQENYSRRFKVAYPNEELPVAREWKTTPVYEDLKAKNAVFGAYYGLENALWFQREGEVPVETPTFGRSNAFPMVAEECKAARTGSALLEAATFAKYEVSGAASAEWLDWLLASSLPGIGRVKLAPMLAPSGNLLGDLSVLRLEADRFLLVGSGNMQEFHMRWFEKQLSAFPLRDKVQLANLTDALPGFCVIGPDSLAVAHSVVEGLESLKFLQVRELQSSQHGFPVIAARVSVTGELGYELYAPLEHHAELYHALVAAGSEHGLRHIGGRAVDSLRLEKSFGVWSREFRTDVTPAAAGLLRFVDQTKPSFIGKENLVTESDESVVTLAVDSDMECCGWEPLWLRGTDECVGYVTSGGYGHTVQKSLVMAYLRNDVVGREIDVSVLGQRRPAQMLSEPAYDPTGARMRGKVSLPPSQVQEDGGLSSVAIPSPFPGMGVDVGLPSSNPVSQSNRFLAMLSSGQPIVCAEGYLFELEKRGYVQFGPFVPEVSLTHPEAIKELHREFVRAGSDIVEAFTYYANRAKLRLIGRENELEALNRAALRIAREVAEETGTILGGNVCNTTHYNPSDPATWEEVRMMFREQITWAAEEGAEVIIGETFDHYGEAVIALEEIQRTGIPAVITFALANWTDGSKKGDQLLLQDDVDIVEACKNIHAQGACVVGLNCHRGPETIIPPLQALRDAGCDFPLAALPVAYQCTHAHPTMQELSAPGKIYSDLDCHTSTRYDFEEFGVACKRLGIQYVGTCCGAAAHHVRALAMAVGKNPEGGNLVPDLKKHFVFGDAEVLENVGNLKGSFLHKQSLEHTKVMSQAAQLRGFASKKGN